MISDYFKMAFESILHRRLRSYLTMIGIIIGIVALVSLITLGNSLEKGITEQFDKFGVRRVFIGPKVVTSFGGPPTGISELSENDVETIESVPQVDYVNAILGETVTIEYGREKKSKTIRGVEVENIDKFYADIGVKPVEGRILSEGDNYAAFVGYRFAEDYFDKQIPLKGSIKLNGKKFRVVGILEEQGDQDNDYGVVIPIETMREILDKPGAVSAIAATVNPGVDVEIAAQKIERQLERKRNDENFQVTLPAKIKEQTGMIIDVVSLIVGAIAAISLVVGGLGIMNTMYTSVFERTRQIGVMKAIGARNGDIAKIFLIESGFMGLVGGTIGIALGVGISYVATVGINALGIVKLSFDLDPNLIVFGIIFSFLLGMGSGTFPALRAAKMNPVDSLRYE